MSNERSNRTRKAEAIAAVLVTVKVTAEHAATMGDMVWQLAAVTGAALINQAEGTTSVWTDASPATRREVVALLAADEAKAANELVAHETDDVFARIAAPHTGPQDQDAPVPTSEGAAAPTEADRHNSRLDDAAEELAREVEDAGVDTVQELADEIDLNQALDDILPNHGLLVFDDAGMPHCDNLNAVCERADAILSAHPPLCTTYRADHEGLCLDCGDDEQLHAARRRVQAGATHGDRCPDCARPVVYDTVREDFRHTEAPERGCGLLPAEGIPVPVGAVRHPAAEHTLNCLAGHNTTGCQC